MAKVPNGKSKFYKHCRLDEPTKKIINWYNRHLMDWKNNKQIFLCKDKDEPVQ